MLYISKRILILLFLLLISSTLVLLIMHPNRPFFDQAALLFHTQSLSTWPGLNEGISSKLLIALYQKLLPFVPSSYTALNTHIKALAAVLFLLSSFSLLRTTLQDNRLVLLGLLLLFTSGYPFLWLSSELFVASAHCLLARLLLQKKTPVFLGILGGFAAFLKPDQPFVVTLFLLYSAYLVRERKYLLKLGGSFLLTGSLLLAPGLYQRGPSYFEAKRSFFSFGQHYSVLFSRHIHGPQHAKSLKPWLHWKRQMAISFPKATTWTQAISTYPRTYLDYLALSTLHSMLTFLQTTHGLLLLLLLLLWVRTKSPKTPPVETDDLAPPMLSRLTHISLIALLGFLPAIALSFVHVRYLARFYPLLVAWVLLLLHETLPNLSERRKKLFWTSLALLSVTLIYQSYNFFIAFTSSPLFWYPD